MSTLLLTNVRPMGGAMAAIRIEGGRIAAIGPGVTAPAGMPTENGGGAVLIPGLVEAHTHLDKSLIGMGWHRHTAGPTLSDKIDNERRMRREVGIDPERQSARQALQSVGFGTTHIRTHVDVDTECGVAGIEGVMAMRAKLAGVVDVEIVAFPQSGMLIRPGTVALMERAMALGADVVGGLDPCSMDRDPKGHLDQVFAWSQKYARPIDIHLHEPGEMGAFSLELIIARTKALGLQGKVAVSHAFCLGSPDESLVAPLIAALARERIHLVTTAPASRPVPAVKRIRDAGILIAAGSDGVRDAWGPYGNGDMLERVVMVGLRNNFRRDDEVEMTLDVCTTAGAVLMGHGGDYGLAVGCKADLVLIEGETLVEAIVSRRPRRLVLKGGRVVARDGKALAAA